MAIAYFCAYHSYLQSMELLNDAERGRLFTALLKYSATGMVPEMMGNERFVFSGIRAQIDRDAKNYEDKCKKQSENARKRWHPEEFEEPKKPEPETGGYVSALPAQRNVWTHPGCMSEEEAYEELVRRVRG